MWTAVKRDDGALLVPVHITTPDGWHADGAIALAPGAPDYSTHAANAITPTELVGNPHEDADLLARWEARAVQTERRSA
ncbi:hypothetical protein ACQPYK_49870 (plasmid) [Streptosporangium sp. CA-135522]|uniref:hypothetical protein n=1 Tax=Streptosporangium sp. CA-135522 TaxID=3240072 RepID=UPI003D8BA83A